MTRSQRQPVEDLQLAGGVVVGDDGSQAAATAIRYAAEEARRRNGPLHVLRAWTIRNAVRPQGTPLSYVPSLEEFEAATQESTRQRVRDLVRDFPDLPWEVHVVHGSATSALVAASRTSDVIVVGSHGLGGVASLLLGSVAAQVIHESVGPVIVVR